MSPYPQFIHFAGGLKRRQFRQPPGAATRQARESQLERVSSLRTRNTLSIL